MILRNRNYTKKEPYRDATLIVIFCEGEKREVDYFSFFIERSSRIRFEIIPSEEGKSSPKGLLEKAEVIYKDLDSEDSIWFVVDTDRWKDQLDSLRKDCHQKKWQVVQSNPNFEVWLYYHFEKFKPFTGMDIGKKWKNKVHEISDGGFNSGDHPKNIEQAISNSKEKFEKEEMNIKIIGCTEVFKLAERFFPFIQDNI